MSENMIYAFILNNLPPCTTEKPNIRKAVPFPSNQTSQHPHKTTRCSSDSSPMQDLAIFSQFVRHFSFPNIQPHPRRRRRRRRRQPASLARPYPDVKKICGDARFHFSCRRSFLPTAPPSRAFSIVNRVRSCQNLYFYSLSLSPIL